LFASSTSGLQVGNRERKIANASLPDQSFPSKAWSKKFFLKTLTDFDKNRKKQTLIV
jgi:hypothetical protein